jgi:tRNA (guanine-N7-)-methyltransferase
VYNVVGEIMRLKHIKNSDTIIEFSPYLIKDKYNHIKCWNKVFDNNNPIEIEIGMGKGNFIISKALNNKSINFIGIEKYSSVLVYAMRKLDDLEINNLKIICVDATEIDKVFEGEVSKIYLNFSDPWPKKRHAKRRLTSERFLEKYKSISKNKLNIELKTDNDSLFEYSVETFENNNFKINKLDRDYKSLYKTEYEEKFISKGKNINYISVSK